MFILLLILNILGQSISEINLNGYGLQEYLLKLAQDNQLDCQIIQVVVERGFGQMILDLIENEIIQHQEEIRCSQNYILEDLRQIKQLQQQILKEEQKYVIIKPILFWAQSKEHLLIKIKFSHRIDAPAYLNVKNHQIMSNSTHLQVNADTTKEIKFNIDIEYFKKIKDEQVNYWKLESVGTMVINITKQDVGLWKQLTKNNQERYLIWWDIKDQIGKDMVEFAEMLEQIEDDKGKRKKKDKIIQQQQQQSQKEEQGLFYRIVNRIIKMFFG